MMFLEGVEFERAAPGVVADYLRATPREWVYASPANLSVKHDGQYLMLQVVNGKVREYPIRKSFLHKLLKWYSFPIGQLQRLSMDTITSLCNDYLLNIKGDCVKVKMENGQALTIVSERYNDFPDLEVIEMCEGLGIKEISRNDFLMRIYTLEKFKTEPIPKDPCGFSLNVINSETGFGALSIEHFILRYVCSNGAVAAVEGASERKIHFGYKEGELQWFLNEQIMKAFGSRIKLVRQLRTSADERAADFVKQVAAKIDRLPGRKATRELLGELADETAGRTGKLGASAGRNYMQKSDERNYIRESTIGKLQMKSATREILSELKLDATKYDLFNLITDKAKGYGLGERLYLERVAGELITG
jgi:hypothetical protein